LPEENFYKKDRKVILTKEVFSKISINGALTKEQVHYLGGQYPLMKGWVKGLIGRDMFDFMYDELLAMKKKKDWKFNKQRQRIEKEARMYGGSVVWEN